MPHIPTENTTVPISECFSSENTSVAEHPQKPSQEKLSHIVQFSAKRPPDDDIASILGNMKKHAAHIMDTIIQAEQTYAPGTGMLPEDFCTRLAYEMSCLESRLFAYDSRSVWINLTGKRSPSDSHTISDELIHVHVYPESINIYLPYLPKKYKGNQDILFRLLQDKLKHTPDLPQWSHWKAAFYFVYPESTRRRTRDVDNYSYKKTIDTIAAALHTTDDAHLFAFDEITSCFTSKVPTGVYIEITPKNSEFPDFKKWETVGTTP